MSISRRKFITSTAAGLTLSSLMPIDSLSLGLAPSDKVRIGLIGCRSQGFYILRLHMEEPNVECTALCDVDRNILNDRAAEVEKVQGMKPALFSDHRKMLESGDLDAV
ncbi:MAG: hypothetical protein WD035_10660, partial [Balneolaceae bacterium]